MWKPKVLWAVGVCAVTAVTVQAQQRGKPATLTPLDYIQIQQLVAKYAYALDTGADNGYAYARLFASDGVFIRGESNGRTRVQGIEPLAALARDSPTRRRGPLTVGHYIVNHVIEPSPGGATGKAYLASMTFGDEGQNGKIILGGHYQDAYVKTPEGWRFKSRQFIESKAGPQTDAPVPAR
jgi:hypothetical protein